MLKIMVLSKVFEDLRFYRKFNQLPIIFIEYYATRFANRKKNFQEYNFGPGDFESNLFGIFRLQSFFK